MILPVSARREESGFCVSYRGGEYAVRYPHGVWESTPADIQELLIDNLLPAVTMHLPMVVPDLEGLSYQRPLPLFEPYLFQNFIRDIPSCADMEGLSPEAETARFLAKRFLWSDGRIRGPGAAAGAPQEGAPRRAVVPMSFGKDSLLTYAIAEELGLEPVMVYVEEPGFPNERPHKLAIAREFEARFGRALEVLEHQTGLLRDYDHLGLEAREYGWGMQSSEYALLMIPFCYARGADLILFGNEQSAASSYPASQGNLTVYPCYDQTHLWTRQIDRMTSCLTSGYALFPGGVRTGSVIEPVMDMMVQHTLVHRYPDYAPYQMSCFVEEGGHSGRWCGACTICAKMYLLCVASGSDPRSIGLGESMLTAANSTLYSLFGGRSAYPYARTDLARDEELFAFYAAYRLGSREELVEQFRRSELYQEAESRADELAKRFCTIYEPLTVPEALAPAVTNILREEIDAFLRRYEER